MNLRSLLLRASLVVALLGFALVATSLTPRVVPNANITGGRTAPSTLLPLIALPLVQALLSP